MKVELIISENFLSYFTAEIAEQAVKIVERKYNTKIDLSILRDEDVKYPVIKVPEFPPIVVKALPSVSELVNMISLALDISRLLPPASLGVNDIGRADTMV
ncbi:MAG: hypothetical protein QXR24_01855 [Thermosphaera sp.]